MRFGNDLRSFQEKIREYSCNSPNRFLQIKGHPKEMHHQLNSSYRSNVLEVNDDYVVFSETVELMDSAAVRVLISPETKHQDAVRILKNVLKAFEKKPEALMKLILRAEIEDEAPF